MGKWGKAHGPKRDSFYKKGVFLTIFKKERKSDE
jgi:hypothetical protein